MTFEELFTGAATVEATNKSRPSLDEIYIEADGNVKVRVSNAILSSLLPPHYRMPHDTRNES